MHDTCDKDEAESEQVTTRVRLDGDAEHGDELLSNPSIQVVTRVKPGNGTLVYNDISELRKDAKNNLSPVNLKDALKDEYAQSEQIILQDPYMPPPPYQKNFDYQSMQSTEPMREIKPVTENVEYREYQKSHEIPVHYNPYYVNNTTPQAAYKPTTVLKYNKNYPYKDAYALPSNYKIPAYAEGPYKYQIPPAMHIHVIKHNEPVDDLVPAMNKPYPVGRPYRHSVVIKKPIHKPKPPYTHVRVNKVPKQSAEPQVGAGSNPVKSVLPPAIRNGISKKPFNIPPPPHAYPAISKKPLGPYISTRKKEEPVKQQYLVNKVEERPENYNYPQAQGGFNPSSIVIESGFKPIIPSTDPQHVAQDRMSEDVEDYVEQDPPKDLNISTENTNETSSEDHSKNPFEGKEPQLFEPIFIPSPLINEQHRKKKPGHGHGMKVKLHKPGQSNIVYIWPNDEDSSVPVKQAPYFNYYAVDTVSAPVYKGYEKNEPAPVSSENVIDGISYQSLGNKQQSSPHTYKVTEYYDHIHPEVSEENNSTEKVLQLDEDKVSVPSNHKIKYIPVSYNMKNHSEDENKFVITIPDGQSTESSNSTVES